MQELIVAPQDLPDAVAAGRNLAFIDLESCLSDTRIAEASIPLVGIGDRAHPAAPALDAIIEEPISADAIARQVERAPKAASVAMQLLRALEGIDASRALMLESMCYGLLQGSAEHRGWLAGRKPAPNALPDGRVRLERRDDVLRIVLDRPEARNAIGRVMRDGLSEAFAVAGADPDIKIVELRAAGAAFSIGGDLEEFGVTDDPASAHIIRSRTLPAQMLAMSGRAQSLHVHVQGACVGAGMELAAFAGRVTASANAWFQLPELAMGLIPGAGGCVSVPGRIGRQRAALMLLSGRRISANTALAWGLVDEIKEHAPDDA